MSDKSDRDTKKIIAERLFLLVGDENQTKIASEIGVDRSLLCRQCLGERNVTIEQLIKYAEYFGVSTDYLLGLTDVKTPDANIQAVHQFIGLDEHSIRLLNSLLTNDFISRDSLIDFLNLIITEFCSQEKLLCELESIREDTTAFMMSIDDDLDNTDDADLENVIFMINGIKYDIIGTIQDILNSFAVSNSYHSVTKFDKDVEMIIRRHLNGTNS